MEEINVDIRMNNFLIVADWADKLKQLKRDIIMEITTFIL